MSVSSTLSILAPSYDSIASRDEYIALATLRVNRTLFGTKADWATALMAAHIITLSTGTVFSGGGSGVVSSKREGDLAITYAVNVSGMGTSNDLNLTWYGKQFLALGKTNTPFIGVTGGNDYYGT